MDHFQLLDVIVNAVVGDTSQYIVARLINAVSPTQEPLLTTEVTTC